MACSSIVRPSRRLTQGELDSFLDKAADILRGNVDHSEFRGYVFALLFFKRISDVYIEEVRKLTEQLGDETLANDPKMHNFVVPAGCLWDEVARKSRNQVGTALNDQRGRWILSRVYIALGRSKDALEQAIKCQEITESNPDEMKDFDLAFAQEGLARAYAMAGDLEKAKKHHKRASELGDMIKDPEDKEIFITDLKGGDWFNL